MNFNVNDCVCNRTYIIFYKTHSKYMHIYTIAHIYARVHTKKEIFYLFLRIKGQTQIVRPIDRRRNNILIGEKIFYVSKIIITNNNK